MHTLKLTQIGNSVGAVFPKDLLARLNLEKGDEFYVTETPDGLRITTHNPEFEAQMRIGREIMKERRDALRETCNWPNMAGVSACATLACSNRPLPGR